MEILEKLPTVLATRGRKKSAHYADIAAGLFPRPVRVGARAVAWPRSEIEAINAARIAGKSDDEIRALVERLHTARQAAA